MSAELTRLADAGTRTVTLVGLRVAAIGPAHSWLRRIAGHWWRQRTGNRPEILVATRLAGSCDEHVVAAEPSLGEGEDERAQAVEPDDVWYGRVDPKAATAIVRQHLADGRPVIERRLPR